MIDRNAPRRSAPCRLALTALTAYTVLLACTGGGGEAESASETSSSTAATTTTAASESTTTDATTSTTTTTTTTTTSSSSVTNDPTLDDQECLEACGALELCPPNNCADACADITLFGVDGAYALHCGGDFGCYDYELCEGGCEVQGDVAVCLGASACDPVDPPPCPVDACVQRWDYECPECGVEFDAARCFAISEACAYPWLACDLPGPCPRVWAYPDQNAGALEVFESEDAAICVLSGLRDGAAATYEIRFGEMGDVGDTVIEAHADGQGGVTIQWTVDCQGCPESGKNGRSGRLELQTTAFFDDCLNAPTTATLLQCVYGFTSYVEGDGLAADYTPPWTTGTCSALEFACPG